MMTDALKYVVLFGLPFVVLTSWLSCAHSRSVSTGVLLLCGWLMATFMAFRAMDVTQLLGAVLVLLALSYPCSQQRSSNGRLSVARLSISLLLLGVWLFFSDSLPNWAVLSLGATTLLVAAGPKIGSCRTKR
jgi:hypothetical protein